MSLPLNSFASEHTSEFMLKCLLFRGEPLGEITVFAIWALGTIHVKVLVEIKVPKKETLSQDGDHTLSSRDDLMLLVDSIAKHYKRCQHKDKEISGVEIVKTAFLNAIPSPVLDALRN